MARLEIFTTVLNIRQNNIQWINSEDLALDFFIVEGSKTINYASLGHSFALYIEPPLSLKDHYVGRDRMTTYLHKFVYDFFQTPYDRILNKLQPGWPDLIIAQDNLVVQPHLKMELTKALSNSRQRPHSVIVRYKKSPLNPNTKIYSGSAVEFFDENVLMETSSGYRTFNLSKVEELYSLSEEVSRIIHLTVRLYKNGGNTYVGIVIGEVNQGEWVVEKKLNPFEEDLKAWGFWG